MPVSPVGGSVSLTGQTGDDYTNWSITTENTDSTETFVTYRVFLEGEEVVNGGQEVPSGTSTTIQGTILNLNVYPFDSPFTMDPEPGDYTWTAVVNRENITLGTVTIEGDTSTDSTTDTTSFSASNVTAIGCSPADTSLPPGSLSGISATIENTNGVDAEAQVEWSANGVVFATDTVIVPANGTAEASASYTYSDLESQFGSGVTIDPEAVVASASEYTSSGVRRAVTRPSER